MSGGTGNRKGGGGGVKWSRIIGRSSSSSSFPFVAFVSQRAFDPGCSLAWSQATSPPLAAHINHTGYTRPRLTPPSSCHVLVSSILASPRLRLVSLRSRLTQSILPCPRPYRSYPRPVLVSFRFRPFLASSYHHYTLSLSRPVLVSLCPCLALSSSRSVLVSSCPCLAPLSSRRPQKTS